VTRVAVAGAGAFGTALALAFARAGRKVILWGRDGGQMEAMRRRRENAAHLPGVALPETVIPTADFEPAAACDILVVAVPTQALAAFAEAHAGAFRGSALVAACKGIERTTGRGPVEILRDARPDLSAAILTGPSFAADIARGLPTALTIAAHDEAEARRLQHALSAPGLRLYRTTDVTGASLGGALKNVVAIAAGIVIGAGLGESARAALMTRGYAEMTRLALAMGARAETLSGLSGFGDLVLTCTSEKSRNFRFGLAIGAGRPPAAGETVEGKATAAAALELGRERGVEMPVTAMTAAVIDGRTTVAKATEALLSRPLKPE